jgi:hypothetical protein
MKNAEPSTTPKVWTWTSGSNPVSTAAASGWR